MKQPSGKTKFLGLLAHPVDHVKAPSFMNPEFQKMGLNWFVIPMHVKPDNLEDAIRGLQKIKNFLGVNLTIPHKEKMTKLCNKLGPNAQRTGTVNAVRFENDLLIGEMFDGVGLIKGQNKHGIQVKNRNCLILGAGGAARAVAFSYIDEGVKFLGIQNRTLARAEKLVADIKATIPGAPAEVVGDDPSDYDIICNCTSLGLKKGDPLPTQIKKLTPDMDVVDIIAARETELMKAAISKGCNVIGGVPMALGQLKSFEKFFSSGQSD